MKSGRNDPCHCGSGSKYKKCHLRLDEQRARALAIPQDKANSTQPGVVRGFESKGYLLGKQVMVTTEARTYRVENLYVHLSRFNLAWMLRRIGEAGSQIGDRPIAQIGNVPITRSCLAFLALAAIQASSDDVARVPGMDDVGEAARIYNGLTEPAREDGDDIFAFLLRMAFGQFCEPNTYHSISRNWVLFGATWQKSPKASGFDIAHAIRQETGLSLPQLLMFANAYAVRSDQAYWVPYSPDSLKSLSPALGVGPEEQDRFLQWVTASYADIRALAARSPAKPGFEKYQLNPLLVKPVIRPDVLPSEAAAQTHVVPVGPYLLRRVSDGIYYALAFAHDAGGGTNPFRVAFGHVFQAYVGELLTGAVGAATILPEWSYGPKGTQRDTPDWMILDGTRLTVIEVKQSALTLNAKTSGDQQVVAADLRRTLARGVQQLLTFRSDVLGRVPGLEQLHAVTELELLLVTHDAVPWGNWILRHRLQQTNANAGDVHLISIEDFENFQRYWWGESPFALLNAKRLGEGTSEFDFNEWLYQQDRPKVEEHPHLAAAYAQFIKSWTPDTAK